MANDHFETLEKIVYDNDLEALKQEIENGTDVNLQNKYGWTLLHIAIRRDRRDMVAYLLEQGADIDKVDGVGWTPLMEAVMDDKPEICAFLIEKGADVTIANARGGTAGMLAQKFGRDSMLKYFR
ncbi:MAG: ankyrin repeat domain-containing protein [Sulfurovum sp.]|nr:ankyrin repeat domain-containing protein [Sulfurovum sp.]